MSKYKDIIIVCRKSKWIIVDGHRKTINKCPTKEELNSIAKWNFKYNETETCDRCKENGIDTKLVSGKTYREKDKDGNETGRWICINCYSKYMQKFDSDSQNNTRKTIANFRTGNLDQNSDIAKAIRSQKLACKLYGWEDLNEKYDNYKIPIDCYDLKTKLYHQVQSRYYDIEKRYWPFTGFEDEWKKIFETMVCFCISADGKIVERIYKFPENVVKNKGSATIVRNSSRRSSWYEKYRETNENELRRANEIWKEILKKGILNK